MYELVCMYVLILTMTAEVYALSMPSSSGVGIPSSLSVGRSSWITYG